MNQMLAYISVIPLALSLCSCSAIGTILVPAHKNSETEAKLVRVRILNPASPAEIPVAAIGVVADLAAKAIVKGIEIESKKYSSTYSARTSGELQDGSTIQVERCIDLVTSDKSCEALLSFAAAVRLENNSLKLLVSKYEVSGAKSKLAWPSFRAPLRWASLWPLHWPASIVLYPWQLFDSDIAKTEFNVQIGMEVLASRDEGKGATLVKIGAVDFPFGATNLSKMESLNDANLERIASPIIALPDTPSGHIFVNLTATVMESNDLGDVIAKGAAEAKKSEESIASKIAELLGK